MLHSAHITFYFVSGDTRSLARIFFLTKTLSCAFIHSHSNRTLALKHTRPATLAQTEKERQAAKLSGRDADAESGSDDERATAAAKSKREQKEKKKKEDPYAGLTRQQRRRKQAMEAETKEIAHERAEERAQRLLAGKQGADSDDDDEDDEAPKSALMANGKPRPVRVTKRDLAAAALRIQSMQNQQKMLAKAIKRDTVRAAGGEGDDDGGGRERGADALGAFADAEATAAAQAKSGKKGGAKRKAAADDAGGDYLDMDELGAGVSALSSAARKKLKRAIADPEAQRFSERRRKGMLLFSCWAACCDSPPHNCICAHFASLTGLGVCCPWLFPRGWRDGVQTPTRSRVGTAAPARSPRGTTRRPATPRRRTASRAKRHSRARPSTDGDRAIAGGGTIRTPPDDGKIEKYKSQRNRRIVATGNCWRGKSRFMMN